MTGVQTCALPISADRIFWGILPKKHFLVLRFRKKPDVCNDEALFLAFLIQFRARSNCLDYAVLDSLNEVYTALKSILDTSFNAKTPTPSTWGAFAPFRNADRYHNLAQLNL